MTEFDHFYDGKAITSDLQMVVTPNLYGKRKRPQWGRFVHAGGISDSEKCFRLHRHRSHAGRGTIQKKSGRVTLTCVGLKVGARWRVCGCDRGARLAAIAPMSVGKMVNRIGMGDVDAQWFRRASNPHPPDRCGRSAMLSYGTVSQPIRRTRWGSTRMGWNGGMGILRRRPHPLHR